MNLSVAICDDFLIHRNILEEYIIKYFKENNITYKLYIFSNGEELINLYPDKVDMLFLDINLPEMNGIITAKKIREFDTDVEIFFITAFIDYVKEGYEVNAFRYLTKPITFDEFKIHIDKCIESKIYKNDRILVLRNKNHIIKIRLNSIMYIETEKRKIIIHEAKKFHRVNMNMLDIECILHKKGFFRCHNSYIINLSKVESIYKNTLIIDGHNIPVSRHRQKELIEKLTNELGSIL